jgi:bifunctional DNA-binding transcriptional regulator/antitoxin component of YhaV-PrlF toxin-antitoxin module
MLKIEVEADMTVLTVTTKGQVTLKKDVLRHLGVVPGGKVEAVALPDGRVELRSANRPPLGEVFGALACEDGPALSLSEIDSIATEGWSGRR